MAVGEASVSSSWVAGDRMDQSDSLATVRAHCFVQLARGEEPPKGDQGEGVYKAALKATVGGVGNSRPIGQGAKFATRRSGHGTCLDPGCGEICLVVIVQVCLDG